jgi:transposase
LTQSFALTCVESNSPSLSCDCFAHRFGNAADGPERAQCYGSDMTDAEWQVIRAVLPVPAWLEGRGGRPESYCHRVMLDAVRYVVDNGGKKVGGRKRHLVVDCLGLVLAVAVTAASVQDRDAAVPLLNQLRKMHFSIRLVWADGGYAGRLVEWAAENLQLTLEIVRRTDDTTGFVVLPRRWVVERTLSWLMRSRRLVRDYETLPAMHEAMLLWSMTMLMSGRLAGRRPGALSRPAPRAR